MTEQVNEKILDKLRKLMAMRDGAGTTQQEAEAFAARVAFLLAQHRLEESQVHDHFEKKERIDTDRVDFGAYGLPKKGYRVLWTEKLARVIADHYFCRFLVHPNSNTISFAGRPMDREVAVFVYVTLARAAIKMAERLHKLKELVRHITDEPVDLKNFKESFYAGFVDGIRDRLAKQQEEIKADSPGFALILVKSDEELQAWADENTVPARSSARGGGHINATGHAAGYEFGQSVPIQTGVGGNRGQKKIGN